MKTLTVGIIILLCLFCDNTKVCAQSCASLYTFTPLTDACDGGNPLPDGTIACIYWDQDNDGPDGSDPLPEIGECPACVNFNCFTLNGDEVMGIPGTFFLMEAFCFVQAIPTPSAFYVGIHIGGNLCWTSEVFVIVQGFTEIELDEWTCGPCPIEPPGEVTGLTATQNLCGRIELHWNAARGAWIYGLYRNGEQFELVPGLSYIDDDVPGPGTCFDYSVQALSEYGAGPLSDAVEGCSGSELPPPQLVTASHTHNDRVHLEWMLPGQGFQVVVWRSEAGNVLQLEAIDTSALNATAYDDFSAAPGIEYAYRLTSLNEQCSAAIPSDIVFGLRQEVIPILFEELVVATDLAGAMSAEVADLDADGDLDVVAAGMFADKVAWYENDGDMNFAEHVLVTGWQGARAVDIGDIDSDGDVDIAAVAYFESSLMWWEKTPAGYVMLPISGAVFGATDVEIVNVTGDGAVEILTTAAATGEISKWEYIGDQEFSRSIFADDLPGLRSLSSGFFRNPNSLRLFAAAHESGELVSWSSVNAYARQSLGFYPGLSACGGAQLNIEADSVVDAFFCVNDDNYLGWRDGATGEVHDVSSLIESPRDVVAARVDGDPRDDLVLASAHEISWWRGTEHRFYRNVITDNLPQASAVRALDFDGDGDMDVLAAGDNEIRLFRSTLADDANNQTLAQPVVEDDGSPRGTDALPRDFALKQNYPNPFNATTQIRFELPEASEAALTIFDTRGREVATVVNGETAAGAHVVAFGASGLPSGVYFCRLTAGAHVETRKMVLLK
ncbi:MAG: T9SS type A sorting domain-containing protein [bacterium]|nr:T9SS type A sorting domain-containing protein [bacterium]